MHVRFVKLPSPPRTAFGRILYTLAGMFVLVAAAFVGVLLFLVLLGLTAIGTIALALKGRWLRRRYPSGVRGAKQDNPHPEAGSVHRRVLEGEYSVHDTRR